MSEEIQIQTCGSVVGSIRPPGSKSITNRALVCAALGNGRSRLTGALDSDDTRVMLDSLRRLGFEVETSDDGTEISIVGANGGIPSSTADLFIGNSGTTVRFLTAMVALGDGTYRLDGVPRMRERPIQDLLDALNQLGVDAQSESGTGCPPVLVRASGIPGGDVSMRGDVSSQYLSGLMMAAPCATADVNLRIEGELVSKPYVEMTQRVMESFGARVTASADGSYTIGSIGSYNATDYAIEPDASAASYFWAIAAITGGDVTVQGLCKDALQGDVGFCDVLQQMGCEVEHGSDFLRVKGGQLRGIDVDMNAISDTVQTLSAVALFANGPTRVRGVAHNRHKETDRIGDLATELRKFGATVDEHEDGLTISPPETLSSAVVDTYDDHRMAMSLSLPGLRIPGVVIRDPGCASKTYPHFFDDLQKLCSGSR
ncbi:MAG: 3-phosphoshikimate 1-carboxyvinyltransferase [Planctomycetales bacterium]|nr:3-phosphoshikimate 1-carboxyvinyltransferase [Planctomycetales bacterium]